MEAPPTALPVALALGARHVGSVRGWLEGTLGWQAVEDDIDAPVPPVVRLIDVDAAATRATGTAAGSTHALHLPSVLLVEDGDAPHVVAEVARTLAPVGVCRWPTDRDALPDLVARALRAPRPASSSSRTLRVGATAGGVGATTVTLALAGLAAWQGRRALAVVHGQAGVRTTTPIPPDALVAPDLWNRAAPVPGVAGLRVVHTGRLAPKDAPEDRRVELAVLDVGTQGDADIVVCRPDGAAAALLPSTMAGAVVVVGAGLLTPERIVALAGGRPVVHAPSSARVARAALRGHVPAGLPGSWLATLAPLLALR
jgi:hypothetical protein